MAELQELLESLDESLNKSYKATERFYNASLLALQGDMKAQQVMMSEHIDIMTGLDSLKNAVKIIAPDDENEITKRILMVKQSMDQALKTKKPQDISDCVGLSRNHIKVMQTKVLELIRRGQDKKKQESALSATQRAVKRVELLQATISTAKQVKSIIGPGVDFTMILTKQKVIVLANKKAIVKNLEQEQQVSKQYNNNLNAVFDAFPDGVNMTAGNIQDGLDACIVIALEIIKEENKHIAQLQKLSLAA